MRNFDELNVFEDKSDNKKTNRATKSIDYERYFGEMDLSEDEKKKRIELAKKIEIVFLYYFTLLDDEKEIDYENMIYEKIVELANEYTGQKQTSAYVDKYARNLATMIIVATAANIDDEYYTSNDRAKFIAENEANNIGNYDLQIQAVKNGKNFKTWITQKDNKVRHTHIDVDGNTIGIFEEFTVGNSKMMFPKDTSLNADDKEIVNCRCVVHYS